MCSTTPRIVAIVNPAAGVGRTRRRLREELRLLSADVPGVTVLETHSASEGRAAAREAAEGGAKVVIAAGGDGTIQTVTAGLLDVGSCADDRPSLAIAPIGRGNDLASALGFTGRPGELRDGLSGSETRPLDVGRGDVDGRSLLFTNALGIGFDAAVARRARAWALPGAGAYVVGILGTLIAGDGPWRLRGRLDREPFDLAVTLLTVGNGPTTGGGFRLTPRADPSDARWDVCWAEAMGRLGALRLLGRLVRGRHEEDPRVQSRRCERLEMEIVPPAPIHADGELVAEAATRIKLELDGGAIHVLRPVPFRRVKPP
ncbi:MAG: hypothetical protein JSV80_16070 [Acidobacteriota bacterium]|nr:MAG: hypothetical protein JSV80_16070 [Acidobacteriota bacterium]